MISQMLVRSPQELKDILQEKAKKKGLTLNSFILQILWEWVKKEENPA